MPENNDKWTAKKAYFNSKNKYLQEDIRSKTVVPKHFLGGVSVPCVLKQNSTPPTKCIVNLWVDFLGASIASKMSILVFPIKIVI